MSKYLRDLLRKSSRRFPEYLPKILSKIPKYFRDLLRKISRRFSEYLPTIFSAIYPKISSEYFSSIPFDIPQEFLHGFFVGIFQELL